MFSNRHQPAYTLKSLPIAIDVLGDPVTLAIRGSHTMVYGLTGSGKGSATANIIYGLTQVPDPVKLYFIDLKQGLEGAYYEHLTADHAYTLADTERLLQVLHDEMLARANANIGKTRNLDPSEQYPQLVLIIDEAAELSNAKTKEDKQVSQHCMQLLDSLLRLGRALGFTCIALSQDPRKESYPLRDRYPQRIALRLNSKEEAQLCLGAAAVERGATPWLLSQDKPGSAWYFNTELGSPQLFRFNFVDDDEIMQFAL